jgi:hypothetical protein
LYKLWAKLIGYLLNSPDLHHFSTSRKELFGLQDCWHGFWKQPMARPK